jgi:hypothetical protein
VNAETSRIGALGTFNLNRAHADAIDSSTMMAWNEYMWRCLNEENRRSDDARAARRLRLLALYKERRERIANRPEELDLLNGDALNSLMETLSNPKIHPYSLIKKGDTIPGETIQRCAFRYPSLGMTISLGRLTVRDGWPPALRGKAFAREREAYRRASENALDQNVAGKLTLDDFRPLEQAVDELRSKLKATIPASQRDDYVQAKTFIDDLAEAIAPLRDSSGEKVLSGIDRYSGTTAGDAVTFVQRYNLRFGPALTPEERESYHLLYAAMVRLRDAIVPFTRQDAIDITAPARDARADKDKNSQPPPAKRANPAPARGE